jgi:hypothetical protein
MEKTTLIDEEIRTKIVGGLSSEDPEKVREEENAERLAERVADLKYEQAEVADFFELCDKHHVACAVSYYKRRVGDLEEQVSEIPERPDDLRTEEEWELIEDCGIAKKDLERMEEIADRIDKIHEAAGKIADREKDPVAYARAIDKVKSEFIPKEEKKSPLPGFEEALEAAKAVAAKVDAKDRECQHVDPEKDKVCRKPGRVNWGRFGWRCDEHSRMHPRDASKTAAAVNAVEEWIRKNIPIPRAGSVIEYEEVVEDMSRIAKEQLMQPWNAVHFSFWSGAKFILDNLRLVVFAEKLKQLDELSDDESVE